MGCKKKEEFSSRL